MVTRFQETMVVTISQKIRVTRDKETMIIRSQEDNGC